MYYPDLTIYTYDVDACGGDATSIESFVVNVGWLDENHPFPMKQPSEKFSSQLFELCKSPMNKMRGFHECPFCEDPPVHMMLLKNGQKILVPTILEVERNGVVIPLGFAEIRVQGSEGKIYAAPNMIYHYVTAHQYQPPEDFVQAVMQS